MLQLALDSIESGSRTGNPKTVELREYPRILYEQRACFVTLKIEDALRGCIGSLVASRPLLDDISANAFAAAFRDPRFRSLEQEEHVRLEIAISVLGPESILEFDSKESLLAMIRPGIDGLILQENDTRATFLPSVWKSIPDSQKFLDQLMLKAGLADDYWSDTLKVWRYATESFTAAVAELRDSREESITGKQDSAWKKTD